MLNHLQIMESVIVESGDSQAFFLMLQADVLDGSFENKNCPIAFARGSVLPECVNLFHASTLMYQQLCYQYDGLQQLLNFAESVKATGIATQLLKMQNDLLTVQRAAVEGVTKVGIEMDRQRGIFDEKRGL